VAAHLKTTHKTYNFDGSKFKELVPMVASALDEPLGDQAMLPLYWLCKEASKEVKVVLSGEGGDELFAGYGYYLPFVAPEWPKSFPWLTEHPERVAPRLLGEPETASGFPILAGQHQIDELIEGYRPHAPNEWHAGLEQWLGTARDSLQRACAADLVTWLPDNLFVKLDRIAMVHSLEGRAPFLSPRLVETALNLSPCQRIDGRVTKTALRQVARGLLPQDIVDRPKQGFVLPMKTWIKDWFHDKGGVSAYLRSSSFPSLSNAALTSLIQQDIDRGVERERLLFAIVMLLEWWKAFKATTSSAKLQYVR
jgi:asparagine synthase (glutamine-hydrolysing)